MNHLCHLFLTGQDHHLILGNLIADFAKPIESSDFPDEILAGIGFHRYIDSTVDSNETFKATIALLRPTQGKYAPVVADMFYDYLLTSQWSSYSDQDYQSFKSVIYTAILEQKLLIKSDRLVKRVEHMVANDFLSSYTSPALIPKTFGFLQRRAKFENRFDQAYEDYMLFLPELKNQFNLVFPDMMQKTEDYRLILRN